MTFPGNAEQQPSALPRQKVVRVPGSSRRAQLEPAPGSEVHPLVPNVREEPRAVSGGTASGINDSRLKAERPPHW